MKEYFDGQKVIHFCNLESIMGIADLEPKTELTIEPSPLWKGFLPLAFIWKYRLNSKGIRVFSYIMEDKYRIEFDSKSERPHSELSGLIGHSHLKFCLQWDELTMESSYYEKHPESIGTESSVNMGIQIISLAIKLR